MYSGLLGDEERALFDAQVREKKAEAKKQDKQQAVQNTYYQMGFSASFATNGHTLKPTRASHNNQAAWERGFNAGKRQQEQEQLKKSVRCSYRQTCPDIECVKNAVRQRANLEKLKEAVK